jgi:hypothetical protein
MSNNWTKLKQSTMKPDNYTTPKKKPAKRVTNPRISKLLQLKYRVEKRRDKYGKTNNYNRDRQLVLKWINQCKFNDISTEDMKQANDMWKRYD